MIITPIFGMKKAPNCPINDPLTWHFPTGVICHSLFPSNTTASCPTGKLTNKNMRKIVDFFFFLLTVYKPFIVGIAAAVVVLVVNMFYSSFYAMYSNIVTVL